MQSKRSRKREKHFQGRDGRPVVSKSLKRSLFVLVPFQRANSWRARESVNSSRRPAAFSTTWTSCWWACWSRFGCGRPETKRNRTTNGREPYTGRRRRCRYTSPRKYCKKCVCSTPSPSLAAICTCSESDETEATAVVVVVIISLTTRPFLTMFFYKCIFLSISLSLTLYTRMVFE